MLPAISLILHFQVSPWEVMGQVPAEEAADLAGRAGGGEHSTDAEGPSARFVPRGDRLCSRLHGGKRGRALGLGSEQSTAVDAAALGKRPGRRRQQRKALAAAFPLSDLLFVPTVSLYWDVA